MEKEKRKLASIQVINDITPIEGADRIECVHVLGWQCVANKGEFHKGDKCIYFEVDSYLPICERFEFLRSSSYKNSELLGEGFRLKTQRFRGQVSQGLVQPMSILPDGNYEIGDDVSEILGVRKWEIPEVNGNLGRIIGDFPGYFSKSDELRVQSYPDLIAEFKSVPEYYISTKMDGTSCSVYWLNGKMGVCTRNNEVADDGKSALWRYINNHNLLEKFEKIPNKNFVIQGEFCGAGIQKNRLKLINHEWYIFTVVNLDTHLRYSLKEMQELCELLGLNTVPVEEIGTDFPYDTIEELIERAKGNYPCGTRKEGIVIRPTEPIYSKTIRGPLSMKVLNNDFLLKG